MDTESRRDSAFGRATCRSSILVDPADCASVREGVEAWQRSLQSPLMSSPSLSETTSSDSGHTSVSGDNVQASALRLLLSTLAAKSVPEALRKEIENVFTLAVGLCQQPAPAQAPNANGHSSCPFASSRQTTGAEGRRPSTASAAAAPPQTTLQKRQDSFSDDGEGSFIQQFSQSDTAALFDMFGGWEGLTAGISSMYLRLIDDPRTSHFFAGVDYGHLVRHMTVIIGNALLGQTICDSSTLREQHSRCRSMGLCPLHVDIMCEHLEAGLLSVGCCEETIQAARNVLLRYKEAFGPAPVTQRARASGRHRPRTI